MSKRLSKEHKKLKTLIGEYAYRCLKTRGATLQIWRNTIPYNVWVESKTGNMLWHCDTEDNYGPTPSMSLFDTVKHEELVHYGMTATTTPRHSFYKLKENV